MATRKAVQPAQVVETYTTEEFRALLRGRRKPGNRASTADADWHVAGTKPKKTRKSNSEEEKQFENMVIDLLRAEGLSARREVTFHNKRKWKIDIVLEDYPIAIEVEGGVFSGGRHVRGQGYEKDCEKYNEVGLSGLLLLRFTTGQVKRGKVIPMVQRAIEKLQSGELCHHYPPKLCKERRK